MANNLESLPEKSPAVLHNKILTQKVYNAEAIDALLSKVDSNMQVAINEAVDELGNAAELPNRLVYLGHLDVAEPTTQQLTDFATAQAQILFGDTTLKTGYTVRDAQDRDWRCVNDGVTPPPPPTKYAVSANVTGNGHVTGTGSFVSGATVVVTANPDVGWQLSSISVDGSLVSSPHTFTMPARPVPVVVVFTAVAQDNRMYDPKDGRYYNTVLLGGLYWTDENYAYAGGGVYYDSANITNESGASTEPFAKAGKLYTESESNSLAPAGWRLPTQAEVVTMANTLADLTYLRDNTNNLWVSGTHNGGAQDDIKLLPAGIWNTSPPSFTYLNERAYFWIQQTEGTPRSFLLLVGTNGAVSPSSNFIGREGGYKIPVRYVREAS